MTQVAEISTTHIQYLFAAEIASAGGTVSDTYDDGSRLLTRSILPFVREVRPNDQVQGGVALRAIEAEVWVHPYVFRQVCGNGAIMAHALQSQQVTLEYLTFEDASAAVRGAIRACCVEEAFAEAAEGMRSSVTTEADLVLNLLPLLSHLRESAGDVLSSILRRFMEEPSQSRFALGNAITAEARDTRDPDLRWRLEEFGGGVLVGASPRPIPDSGRATHRQLAEPVVA